MKRDERSIDDILQRSLPSAPKDQMDAALDRIHSRLRSDRGGATSEPSVDIDAARGVPWRWVAVTTAAALLVAAAWVGSSWNNAGVHAVLETADGSLYRMSRGVRVPVRLGARIEAEEVVRSNGEAGAGLTLTDGSRVEMRSQSELALERADDGVRIRLIAGGIIVNAARQRAGHLYVTTRDVTVSVVGTVFLVNAEEQGSRVAVIEGEVHVQQGTTEKTLLPGEQVATRPLEWQPVSDEISWSRNVKVHIALLQQTAPGGRIAEPREAFEVESVRPAAAPAGSGGRGAGGGVPRRNPRPAEDPCGSSNEPVIDARRFDASNTTLVALTLWAYGLDCSPGPASDLLFGGPNWIKSDGFDVIGVIPEGTPSYTRDQLLSHGAPKLQSMLQTLLAERFNLVVHREAKEMPVYVLTVAKGGPRFIASSAVRRPAPVTQPGGRVVYPPGFGDPTLGMSVWREGDDTCCQSVGPGLISGKKKSMAWLARMLARTTGRPVLDRTGLTGEFNYQVTFEPDPPMPPGFPADTRSVLTAIEQDFGLKLEASSDRVEVLVIDRVERPTDN